MLALVAIGARQRVGTKRALRSGVKKPPSAKKRVSRGAAGGRGHWNGASVVVVVASRSAQALMSRSRVPAFAMPVSAAYSAKIAARTVQSNAAAKPIRLATSASCHQSGARFAGRRQERALARDAALGVGDGAVLLAPGERRQQHVRKRRVSVWRVTSETTTNGQRGDRCPHRVRLGHRVDRVGRHDPQRLDAAVADRAEHVDGLEARLRSAIAGERQKRCTMCAMSRVVDLHVGCEHVGEAADLATAHRVGLAGNGERPHAGLADAAGREVAIDDRVDLVGAGTPTG